MKGGGGGLRGGRKLDMQYLYAWLLPPFWGEGRGFSSREGQERRRGGVKKDFFYLPESDFHVILKGLVKKKKHLSRESARQTNYFF